MEGHQSMVFPPSSGGVRLFAQQDVMSSTAGKQIMKVEKFVQEVRELYLAKSKLVKYKIGDAMSPVVIVNRLSPRAIEQHTRQHANRLRSTSLSEWDDSSASSDGAPEEEIKDTLTQNLNVPTSILHGKLSEGQAEEKTQEECNKENVAGPSEGSVFSTSFEKDVVQSGDDDTDSEDVLDSDYSGDLPDLTDPSWESPSKAGSRKKSPSKKAHKKKHKRAEDNFRKRKDPKLMKSAKKAFEHKRKMFISSKKYKRLKDEKDSNSSRLSSHKPKSPELEQSGAQPGSWDQPLSDQPPNLVTAANQDTTSLPVETPIIQGVSTTLSASDSRKEKIRMLIKANMGKSLIKPPNLLTEEYSVAQSWPPATAVSKHVPEEGTLLTQGSSQSSGRLVSSSLSNPEAPPIAAPLDRGTTDIPEVKEPSEGYDSDETVTFEGTATDLGNLETCSNDVLVNSNNNNIVKRVDHGKSVVDCAVDSNKRKRQGSESVEDESCGEASKRIKQEKSDTPQVAKAQAPMVIIPSTRIETLVSATPASVSTITNVRTVTADRNPLQDQIASSLKVAEMVSDVHAQGGAQEEETHTCTGRGKGTMKEETASPVRSSPLMLKSQFSPHMTSFEDSEDRGLPSTSSTNVELAATGENDRNSESTTKGFLCKPIKSIKEFSGILKKLSHKRTECEEKIKNIREECNKKIEMLEAEKKEYEKEMEKMVCLMQNWREPPPVKSKADASQGSASNGTVQNPVAVGTSQRSTADIAQNTSLESASQRSNANASQGSLPIHTNQGSSSALASLDTGSVEGQQSTNKLVYSYDVSTHKLIKRTTVKTIPAANLGESSPEKLSGTRRKQKLTINIISAANINRFGNANTSPVKKGSKKSPSKTKVTGAPAVPTSPQTVPAASTSPAHHLDELMSQTPRGSSHGTSTLIPSGTMLLPQNMPSTQVQSSTSSLWPPMKAPGPQICPNVVVTSLMQNSQQQPARFRLIQPMPPPTYPPPSYSEHVQTLRAVAPPLNQHFSVNQQGTPNGMQKVSNVQPGAQMQQIQAQPPQLDQQHQMVSVQQQQSLQQPQQQVQPLTIQTHTQHNNSHQLTQSSQQPKLQQLLQQQHQKLIQQQHRTTKQDSVVSIGNAAQMKSHSTNEGSVTPGSNLYVPAKKITEAQQGDVHTIISSMGSKAGHQSHLLVSATPAPTLGVAVARSAQPTPSTASRSVCGSKPSGHPSTQLLHTPANLGTEPPRVLQSITAPLNTTNMTVVQVPGLPATVPLDASQESPIDFSGGGRSKVMASTAGLAMLSQQSCFLCGEKGELLCCNSIVYCGPSCQVKDWSRHEPECSHKNS